MGMVMSRRSRSLGSSQKVAPWTRRLRADILRLLVILLRACGLLMCDNVRSLCVNSEKLQNHIVL